MLPKVCPICCTASIELMLRDTLLSTHIDGLACPSLGALVYHCNVGHVFLLISDQFKWEEPIQEGSGYSVIV